MPEVLPFEFERRSDRLYIHFGVQDHYIKLDTFVRTAASAHDVIKALDATFFKGVLDYELLVVPPEAGSFLAKLVIVLGSAAAFVTITDSDILSNYVAGLTGKTPAEWAFELGKHHHKTFEEPEVMPQMADDAENGTDALEHPPGWLAPFVDDEEIACMAGARIITAMTREILERDTDELRSVGMEVGNLPEALDARADFYLACFDDKEVQRIGFTPTDDFPIPRNSFPERAQRPVRREEDDDVPEWVVSIESIYVTSPNWDKDDQRTRQWKGKDETRRDCYFVIDDAEFWGLVTKKDLHVEVLDDLKVQWAYQIADGRPKNRRVLRVLEFNGDKLAEPLSPAAIKAVLGHYLSEKAPQALPSLFTDTDDRWRQPNDE
ncbi:hypothetical protein [Roseibium sp. M-1]